MSSEKNIQIKENSKEFCSQIKLTEKATEIMQAMKIDVNTNIPMIKLILIKNYSIC